MGGGVGVVIVPCETYELFGGRVGVGWYTTVGAAAACNSGLLDMIFCAREITLFDGFTAGGVVVLGCEGTANASSASFSATL